MGLAPTLTLTLTLTLPLALTLALTLGFHLVESGHCVLVTDGRLALELLVRGRGWVRGSGRGRGRGRGSQGSG